MGWFGIRSDEKKNSSRNDGQDESNKPSSSSSSTNTAAADDITKALTDMLPSSIKSAMTTAESTRQAYRMTNDVVEYGKRNVEWVLQNYLNEEQLQNLRQQLIHVQEQLQQHNVPLQQLEDWFNNDQVIGLGVAVVACTSSFLLGIGVGRIMGGQQSSSWRRITSLQDVPSSRFGSDTTRSILRGRAVSVSDGDTFRFYHVPTWLHSSTLPEEVGSNHHARTKKKKLKLSDITLPIRVCTIDTPETAKFGQFGQPFGKEAKERLSQLILHKMIRIQLLERDQYGRAVALVQAGRTWLGSPRFVDSILLQEGLAEVYTRSGAVYGPHGKDYYMELQSQAKARKKGIWSLDENERESASEYKVRMKQQQEQEKDDVSS